MGRDNNNAGIHYQKHSPKGKFEDLGYYDRNSDEARTNRRNEAMAYFERMGEYPFTKKHSFIRIYPNEKKTEEFEYAIMYDVMSYDNSGLETLKNVSSRYNLVDEGGKHGMEIPVRIHNNQRVVYILKEELDKYPNIFNRNIEYRIVNIHKKICDSIFKK